VAPSTLYQGPNDNGQHVFSWVADANLTSFAGDISPLVHYLWRHNLVLATNYIGVVQFGTEQKFATSNVTFVVDSFAMDASKGTPKEGAGASLTCYGWDLMLALFLAAVAVNV
jgi:xyloglucan-specific endo-beta-1,4-glucanase